MLSGIGAAVLPPPAPDSSVIAPPPAAAAPGVSPPITLPVERPAVRLVLPPQVRAGTPVNVTAVALDAAGQPLPSFNGTGTVTSTDPAATLPLVLVVFRDGRASFQVQLATSGRQSVTVTSLGESPVSGTASTMVVAQPAVTSFLVAMPARIVAGTPVSVSLTALDAARRPVRGFTGSAALSSSDRLATLPATVAFKDGRATATVTFATAGRQTLAARAGVAGEIAGSMATTVTAAPTATRFALTLPRAVPAGVTVAVTIVAVDALGRPVPTHGGSATLSSTDPMATFPRTITFVNGRATVRGVFTTLGRQTLSVSQPASSAAGGSIVGSGSTQVGEITVQTRR